jgi:hypothetical protein
MEFHDIFIPKIIMGFNPRVTTAFATAQTTKPFGQSYLSYNNQDTYFDDYQRSSQLALVASTSTADIETNTSGVSKVKITGVDENFHEIEEIVNLKGQATVTGEKYFRGINKAEVIRRSHNTPGSTTAASTNQGVIDIGTGSNSSGSISIPRVVIDIGKMQSQEGHYYVPLRHVFIITKITTAMDTTTRNPTETFRWTMAHIKPLEGHTINIDGYHGGKYSGFPVMGGITSYAKGMDNIFRFEQPYVVNGGEAIFFEINETTASCSATIIVEGYYSIADTSTVYKPRSKKHFKQRAHNKNVLPPGYKEKLGITRKKVR